MRKRDRKHLNIETVYSGSAWTVTRETVVRAGLRQVMEIIRHPGTVCVVAKTPENKILLVRQYRQAVDESLWEVPAGTLQQNEDALAGAKRELEEETGFVPGRLRQVGCLLYAPEYSDNRLFIFAADRLTCGKFSPEEDEEIEIRHFSWSEIQRMLSRGAIKDAKSVISLHAVRPIG